MNARPVANECAQVGAFGPGEAAEQRDLQPLAHDERLGVPLGTVGRVLEDARRAGLAEKDMAEVLRLLRNDNQLEER